MKKDIKIKHIINGKIVKYKEIKTVGKVSKGGHVYLPKELVGKKVEVTYNDENYKNIN